MWISLFKHFPINKHLSCFWFCTMPKSLQCNSGIHVFISHLLSSTKHCARYWRYRVEQNSRVTVLIEACDLVGEVTGINQK